VRFGHRSGSGPFPSSTHSFQKTRSGLSS